MDVPSQPRAVPSVCDLLRTAAAGGGKLQSGCSKTHTHPLGCCLFGCNPMLGPIPAICRKPSIFTQPWVLRLQLRSAHLPSACPHRWSQLAQPGAALFPRPSPTSPGRPTGWVFTGSCHHSLHSPCSAPCSLLPSFSPGTKNSTWH